MQPFPWRLVTVDIDGTLTTVHGWARLAAAAGRTPEYRAEHDLIERGEVDEDTHLAALFRLAVGLTEAEVDRVLEATPKVRAIGATVAALHARGARVALLTHNPDYVIDWYGRRFGFDGGTGGWGSRLVRGRVAPPRGVRADKVRGLRELERSFGVPGHLIAHVGDAWPDARLRPLVGGFIAFNAARADVRREGDAVLKVRGLDAILPVLERLRPRRVVNGARPLAEDSNTRPRDAPGGGHGVRRPRRAAPALAEPPSAQRGRRAAPVPARRRP